MGTNRFRATAVSLLTALVVLAGCGGSAAPASSISATPASSAAPASSSAPSASASTASAAPNSASANSASVAASASASTSTGSVAGPTLKVAIPDIFTDLSPYQTQFPYGYYAYTMYEGLGTLQTKDGSPQPLLAESWKNVDPTTWQVTLRDAKFWDGTPVTADDVVFSLTRGLDAKTSNNFTPITLATIASVTAQDAKTVIIKTKAPDPVLLNRISAVNIYSKKAFEAAGSIEKFNLNPMGTGPFKFKSFQSKQQVVVVANDNYWGGKPKAAGIVFNSVPDAATRVASVSSGDSDMAERVSLDQLSQVKQAGKAVTTTYPVMVMVYLDTAVPQLKDPRARVALNEAIDLNSIAKNLLQGITKPAPGDPANEQTYGYNPAVHQYAYDPNKAKADLAAAGYPNGFSMTLGYPTFRVEFQQAAEAIQPYLAKIGVNVTLKAYGIGPFLDGFTTNKLGPMVVSAMSTAELQDPAQAYGAFTNNSKLGGVRYDNAKYNALYQQAVAELDRNKRIQLFQQMNQILHDDPAGIYLWGFWDTWAVSNKVTGFDTTPQAGEPPFLTISKSA